MADFTNDRSQILQTGADLRMRNIRLGRISVERVLVAAVVFLAPANFLRPDGIYFTLGDALTCLTLVVMLINRTVPLRPFGAGTALWSIGLVLLTGGLLVSSVMADALDRGFIAIGQYLFAWLVIPLALLARPYKETVILLKLFVLSITIACLHGIYLIDVIGEVNTRFVSASGRLLGVVERENEFGSLVAIAAPVHLWLVSTRRIGLVPGIAALGLMVYGVLLTGSNSALIALAIGCGGFAALTMKPKHIGIAIVAVGASVTALSVPTVQEAMPEVFQKRVLESLISGDIQKAGTFIDRLKLMREAQQVLDETALVGFGADQYRVVSDWRAPVHNLFLLLWTEGGAIAMIGFLVMLAGALLAVALPAVTGRIDQVTAACSITAILVFAALVNTMPHVYGRFWAVAFVLAIAPSLAPSPRRLHLRLARP